MGTTPKIELVKGLVPAARLSDEGASRRLADAITASDEAREAAGFSNDIHGKGVSVATFALDATEVATSAVQGAILKPISLVGSGIKAAAVGGARLVSGHPRAQGPDSAERVAERINDVDIGLGHIAATYGRETLRAWNNRFVAAKIQGLLRRNPDLLELMESVSQSYNGTAAQRAWNFVGTRPDKGLVVAGLLNYGIYAAMEELERFDEMGTLPEPVAGQPSYEQLSQELREARRNNLLSLAKGAHRLPRGGRIGLHKPHFVEQLPHATHGSAWDDGDGVQGQIADMRMSGSWGMRLVRFAFAGHFLDAAAKECGRELKSTHAFNFLLRGEMPPTKFPAQAVFASPGEDSVRVVTPRRDAEGHPVVQQVALPFQVSKESSFTLGLLALVFAGQEEALRRDGRWEQFQAGGAVIARLGSETYEEDHVSPVMERCTVAKYHTSNVNHMSLDVPTSHYLQYGASGLGSQAYDNNGVTLLEHFESPDSITVWSDNAALMAFMQERLRSDDPAIKATLGKIGVAVIRSYHYVPADADIKGAACELVVPTLAGAIVEGLLEVGQFITTTKSPWYKSVVDNNEWKKDPFAWASIVAGAFMGIYDDSTGASVYTDFMLSAVGKKETAQTLYGQHALDDVSLWQHMKRHTKLVYEVTAGHEPQVDVVVAENGQPVLMPDPVVRQAAAGRTVRVLGMAAVNLGLTTWLMPKITAYAPAKIGPTAVLMGASWGLCCANAGVLLWNINTTTLAKIKVHGALLEQDVVRFTDNPSKRQVFLRMWNSAVTDITSSIEGKSGVLAWTFVPTIALAWLANMIPMSEKAHKVWKDVLTSLIFGAQPGYENAETIAMAHGVRASFKKHMFGMLALGFTEGIDRACEAMKANGGNLPEETEKAILAAYTAKYPSAMRSTWARGFAKFWTLWALALPLVMDGPDLKKNWPEEHPELGGFPELPQRARRSIEAAAPGEHDDALSELGSIPYLESLHHGEEGETIAMDRLSRRPSAAAGDQA